MQPLPHHYIVAARGDAESLLLTAKGLPDLQSAPPPEYDGPGDRWSPESLLCAAVASCFILTFRAVARASKLEWRNLECSVEGALDRVERQTRFTKFVTTATLTVDSSADQDLCRRVLERAEQGCLVSNSLNGQRELRIVIQTAG